MYSEWVSILIKMDLFKGIDKKELETILFCLKPNIKKYNKKEIIAIENTPQTSIGIVLQGEVTVTKETLAGDRVILSRLGKGSLFGEIPAFANNIWLATVVADTECTILFLPPQRIVGVCPNMCSGHKVLIQNMLRIVSRKALGLNKKVEILSLKSIRKKVSAYLLEEYMKKNTLTFEIPLKRNELAEFLLVSRPSLSRELIKMQEEGVIDFYRNSFKIMDLGALKAGL